MTKLSSLFVMPVKEKDDCARYLLTLLDRTLSRYIFSLCHTAEYKYPKCSPSKIITHKMVSLHLMFVAEYEETKCILDPFFYQYTITVITLFKHVLQTVCLYSIMCVRFN